MIAVTELDSKTLYPDDGHYDNADVKQFTWYAEVEMTFKEFKELPKFPSWVIKSVVEPLIDKTNLIPHVHYLIPEADEGVVTAKWRRLSTLAELKYFENNKTVFPDTVMKIVLWIDNAAVTKGSEWLEIIFADCTDYDEE